MSNRCVCEFELSCECISELVIMYARLEKRVDTEGTDEGETLGSMKKGNKSGEWG